MSNRLIVFAFSVLLLCSCAAGKKSEKNTSSDETSASMEGMTEGIVRISNGESDCAVRIESDAAGDSEGFYPVNLDEKFKKDGLKIYFSYSPSRAPLPDNCIGLTAIVIDSVK